MRRPVDRPRLQQFMVALARSAQKPTRIYLVGGASAVLEGWRDSTIDVDLTLSPESDALLRAIPALKESMSLNVELASPAHFIPPLPGWEDRSAFVAQHGQCSYYHYDFYGQALAKLERGHQRDAMDVAAMVNRGLVEPARLLELFAAIEPELYRYPALDPASFRVAVETFVRNV